MGRMVGTVVGRVVVGRVGSSVVTGGGVVDTWRVVVDRVALVAGAGVGVWADTVAGGAGLAGCELVRRGRARVRVAVSEPPDPES